MLAINRVESEEESALAWDGERYIPGMLGVIELEHLHRYFFAQQIAGGLDVLDIASGEGYGSFILSQVARTVMGVDISAGAVAHADQKYRNPNLVYQQGSCAAIPLADKSVDLVVSFETIEHHTQHEEMMSEVRRVLRPGGILIISSPDKHEYSDVGSFDNRYHVKELYRKEFIALLERHFPVVDVFGQRVLSASVLLPEKDPQRRFVSFTDLHNGQRTTVGMSRPLYHLAIASDVSVPPLPMSLLEGVGHTGAQATSASVDIAQCKVYWQMEGMSNFTEDCAASRGMILNVGTRTVRLPLDIPEEGKCVALRLDFSDRFSLVELKSLHVELADGEILWKPGDLRHCLDGLHDSNVIGNEPEVVELLAYGEDPHCTLVIEPEILGKLSHGCTLVVEAAGHSIQPALSKADLEALANRRSSNTDGDV